jgi:hypothetical protein
MTRRISLSKRILFAAVPIVAVYVVLETVATTIAWVRWWDTSLWLFEDSGRTWRFDAVRGYRLTSTPSRFARITQGTVEFLGTARGNAQGFPDRDDFTTRRKAGGALRIAVFGDSFTEAQYLRQNWPDRAEDLARAGGRQVELLNFAVSGGGLANWWSVLTRLVGPDGYDLDGVIFAVYAGDLRRTFSMWEHRGGPHPLFGRTPGWDPQSFPTTLAEARPLLHEHPGLILSTDQFQQTLQGAWPAGAERRLRPFFLTRAWRLLRRQAASGEALPEAPAAPTDPSRARLVEEIGHFLKARDLPALVILIPDRESMLSPERAPAWPAEEARAFAAALGAELLDSARMFQGLNDREIRAQFLPYDGHWSQAGSDRFAEFVVRWIDRFAAAPHATRMTPPPKEH